MAQPYWQWYGRAIIIPILAFAGDVKALNGEVIRHPGTHGVEELLYCGYMIAITVINDAIDIISEPKDEWNTIDDFLVTGCQSHLEDDASTSLLDGRITDMLNQS